jgi:hypothetical protein
MKKTTTTITKTPAPVKTAPKLNIRSGLKAGGYPALANNHNQVRR